jgi:hypothetical protein
MELLIMVLKKGASRGGSRQKNPSVEVAIAIEITARATARPNVLQCNSMQFNSMQCNATTTTRRGYWCYRYRDASSFKRKGFLDLLFFRRRREKRT